MIEQLSKKRRIGYGKLRGNSTHRALFPHLGKIAGVGDRPAAMRAAADAAVSKVAPCFRDHAFAICDAASHHGCIRMQLKQTKRLPGPIRTFELHVFANKGEEPV